MHSKLEGVTCNYNQRHVIAQRNGEKEQENENDEDKKLEILVREISIAESNLSKLIGGLEGSEIFDHEGPLVFLEGHLKTDKYEDKGETKFYTKVVCLSMQMLDRKPSEEPVLTVEEQPIEYEA